MPKQNIINTNFTSGEVSPLVRGRVDAQKYGNGLETCENFIVRPQGPIWRRSGTKYLGPIKFKTGKAILFPFEYSDARGYVLEIGRGYIHVWQGDGKLFETTASEIEKFTLETDTNLYTVRSNLYEYDVATGINKAILPAFGNLSTPYSKYSGVGTATTSKSGASKIRITTSVPNTIRSGANVYLYLLGAEKTLTAFADNGSGLIRVTCANHGFPEFQPVEITGQTGTAIINGKWQAINVTTNTFDLATSSYTGTFVGTIKARASTLTPNLTATRISPYSFDVNQSYPDLYAGQSAIVWTTGLLPGDRIYISGATDVDDFGERHVIVQELLSQQTTNNRDEFITNINSPGGDETPQNEEGWVIPIEILTDYGYLKSQPIKGITNNGANLVRVEITNHGFSTGDTVNIYQTNSSADGDWEITVVNSNFFDLVGSTFYSTSSSGYGRKYLDPLQDELEKIRFVQSADVMYLMHPSLPTKKLTRLSNDGDRNDWVFADVDFKDGPYLEQNSLAPTWNTSNPSLGTRFPDVFFELSNYSHSATAVCGRHDCTLTKGAGNVVLFNVAYPHGLAVGDVVKVYNSGDSNVDGLRYVQSVTAPPTPPSETTTKIGNGSVQFTISATSGGAAISSSLTLNTSGVYYKSAFSNTDYSATLPRYIEYREGDEWRIARVTQALAIGDESAAVEIVDNVLLYIDETTKFTNNITYTKTRRQTYSPGSQNSTGFAPGAGKRRRNDPNNFLWVASATKKIVSNFSNTFGKADVGKWFRYGEGQPATPLSIEHPFITRWGRIKRIENATGGTGNAAVVDLRIMPQTAANEETFETKNFCTGKFQLKSEKRTAILKSLNADGPFSAFQALDVGRVFRMGWAGRITWGKIVSYTSSSEVGVELYEDIPRDTHNALNLAGSHNGSTYSNTGTARTYDWRMGAWSERTGYPSCGVFHEQRLWFGATTSEPQTVWGSVSGDFENMSPTELDSAVLEDNAVVFTIASTKANPIKWMVSGPAMTVGTIGAEWQIKSSSATTEPITPFNIVVVPHTNHGSNYLVQPLKLGSSTLFVDRTGKKVKELVYDFQIDGLSARDITYLSEHMFRKHGGAIASAYQQEPNNSCWYVLGDGTLACVTINKDQEIVAWHHHSIPGAAVESVAVIPSVDATSDSVYLVVNRNGNRYVELLQNDFYPNGTNKKGMVFLDGSIVFSDTSFTGTVVAGLHHLEGKNVVVAVNGQQLGTTYSVTSGRFSIDNQTNAELVVGFPYTSTAKSLPPEGGSAFGVSQGKIKKLAKYNVRLLNSLALDYGFNSNGQSLNSITNLHENGTSTDFYNGTKELIPNNPYDAESQWTLSTNKPYPLNILSVTMTVETGE